MPVPFTYYNGDLRDFIAKSIVIKDSLLKIVISNATETLVIELLKKDINIEKPTSIR